jgi:hypothetical protein
MSGNKQKNTYNLFTTPIDDLYNEIDQGYQNDSFVNLEGLISGLNCIMKENEVNNDSELSFMNVFEEVSTKASSPFEKNFLHNKSDNIAFFKDTPYQSSELKQHISKRGKKIKISKCMKKEWKTKILSLKDNSNKYYISNLNSINQKFSMNFQNNKGKF